jgi:protocatechuate 3,4-dioxygenase beta subunit
MKLLFAIILLAVLVGNVESAVKCPPTKSDALGPFYKPDAPVRNVIGSGYVLTGTVRSSADCGNIPEARIEVWQAGPDGKYADAYRATVVTDTSGQYRLQTDRPPGYSGRPPHIHIRVTASGYNTLITQHYPVKEASEAVFDLILVPAGRDKIVRQMEDAP